MVQYRSLWVLKAQFWPPDYRHLVQEWMGVVPDSVHLTLDMLFVGSCEGVISAFFNMPSCLLRELECEPNNRHSSWSNSYQRHVPSLSFSLFLTLPLSLLLLLSSSKHGKVEVLQLLGGSEARAFFFSFCLSLSRSFFGKQQAREA